MSETNFDEQFMKLFKSIEDMKSQLANVVTKEEITMLRDEMHAGFDGIAARLDIDDSERAAAEGQVNRHEGWITQLADNTGTKLVPER